MSVCVCNVAFSLLLARSRLRPVNSVDRLVSNVRTGIKQGKRREKRKRETTRHSLSISFRHINFDEITCYNNQIEKTLTRFFSFLKTRSGVRNALLFFISPRPDYKFHSVLKDSSNLTRFKFNVWRMNWFAHRIGFVFKSAPTKMYMNAGGIKKKAKNLNEARDWRYFRKSTVNKPKK